MRRTNESGFSLFEILIAIAVFSVVGVSVAQIIGVALQSDKTAGQKTVGTELAQETMNAVNALTAEQWNNIYGLSKGSGNKYYPANTAALCGSVKWCVKSGTSTTTVDGLDYIRSFYVDNVSRTGTTTDASYISANDDPSTQKVTVAVAWQATGNSNQLGSVSISNYFTRSRNSVAVQTSWNDAAGFTYPGSGENGAFGTSASSTDSTNVSTSTPGWIQLTADGDAAAPVKRKHSAGAWDTEKNRMLVFGGADATIDYNDLWCYSGSASVCTATSTAGWVRLTTNGDPSSPIGRESSVGVWDALAKRFLIFSGVAGGGISQNDLWCWSDTANRCSGSSAAGWYQMTAPGGPTARFDARGAWDSQGNRILVFGGHGGLNDLWSWDATNGWIQLIANGAGGSPAGRDEGAMVWDSQANRLLLYGGFGGWDMNDLWCWNASANICTSTSSAGWTNLITDGDASSPSGRMVGEAGVWDALNNRFLIFGGYNSPPAYRDTWAWDASNNWKRLIADSIASSPAGRLSSTAVWDSQGNRMLVFGGTPQPYTTNYVSDLWAYAYAQTLTLKTQ